MESDHSLNSYHLLPPPPPVPLLLLLLPLLASLSLLAVTAVPLLKEGGGGGQGITILRRDRERVVVTNFRVDSEIQRTVPLSPSACPSFRMPSVSAADKCLPSTFL